MELPKGFKTTPQSEPIYQNLLKRIRTVVPLYVSFTDFDRVTQLIKDAEFKPSVTASMFRFILMFDEVKADRSLSKKYLNEQKQAEALHVDVKVELDLPSSAELVKKFEEQDETSRDHLITAMYVMFPAVRPATWVNLSFEQSKDTNWYDIENRLLYINRQKSKSAGKIIVRVPEYLADLIEHHSADWTITSNNVIYRTLKRCLGVSPTQMRKVWTRHLEQLDAEQKAKVRRVMGHNIATSKIYYTK